MKAGLIIGLSAALNVALVAAIFLAANKVPPPVPAADALQTVSKIVPSLPAKISPTPGLPFEWSQVASEDLKIYRDNLRAIGCPELTVREIIRAVINENFGTRRRDILLAFQGHYWDMVLHGQLVKRQWLPQSEWGLALTSLTAERQQLISDVLGSDALTTEAERQKQHANWEQKYSWLPAGKRSRMIELEEQYQQHLADWAASLGSRINGVPAPEDEDRLQQWQKEFDDSEKQLLTSAELAELRLRDSSVAGWATSLPGFNPTEDEWRSLTQLRSQFEESQNALANPDLTDDERAARQNELQTNFDNALQTMLDPDRLAQYQLANNDQYQALHNVTQRYGLADSVAAQGLNVQQTAQSQADLVRASSNLSPEAQQAALNAIQQETEQTLSQILGPNVLATYKEYGGDWITGLSQQSHE
jgi:hypothetical protein